MTWLLVILLLLYLGTGLAMLCRFFREIGEDPTVNSVDLLAILLSPVVLLIFVLFWPLPFAAKWAFERMVLKSDLKDVKLSEQTSEDKQGRHE